jgi:hypothetical protein
MVIYYGELNILPKYRSCYCSRDGHLQYHHATWYVQVVCSGSTGKCEQAVCSNYKLFDKKVRPKWNRVLVGNTKSAEIIKTMQSLLKKRLSFWLFLKTLCFQQELGYTFSVSNQTKQPPIQRKHLRRTCMLVLNYSIISTMTQYHLPVVSGDTWD